jgi:hypothetical protein
MRNAVIIFILLAAGFTTAAQKSFSEGYIVTLKNDTIKGKVKDYYPARFSFAPKKISFIDSSGIEKVYMPKDLSGYSKADMANYLSVDVGNGKNFVKVEIDGFITLLSIKGRGTSTMFVPGGTGGMHPVSGGTYETETFYLYKKQDSAFLEVTKMGFKEWVANFVADYTKLKEMILNKELRYEDIEIIVKMYNKWKAQQLPDKT